MNTFIRENKGKLLLLLILTPCLVGLRTVHIHQVWYYLTPWQDLGAPPKPAERIMEIKLPEPGGYQSVIVYVKGRDRDFFGCCSLTEEKGWAPSDKPYYKFYGSTSPGPGWCAELIRDEWNIQEDLSDAKKSMEAGQCNTTFLYTVFQIRQDGSVRGKIIDEKVPNAFKRISFEAALCLLLGDLILLALSVRKKIHEQDGADPLKADAARLILSCLIVVAVGAMAFRYFSDIDEKIQREIPGKYFKGLRTQFSFDLVLRADHTYLVVISLGNDGHYQQEGQYTVENGGISFSSSVEHNFPINLFRVNSYFIPIQWGERIYLVERQSIADFCENDFDLEPRENSTGTHFLRQDDWNLPAEGEPRFMDGRKTCP